MDSMLMERVARITASVFFLFLLIATAHSVGSIVVGPQSILSGVALFAKLCVILFYAMIVWFTLTRDRPLAQAAGWQPRVTALLGSFLFMASLVWLKKPELGLASHLTSAAFLATGTALMLALLSSSFFRGRPLRS